MTDTLTAQLVATHHPDVRPQPDQRDEAILAERAAAYLAAGGPAEGDWVDFADGVVRRISYVHKAGTGDGFWIGQRPFVQTSDAGSYYLGDGYISMSGSLHDGVHPDTLTDTGKLRLAPVWFFHHDWHRAHNAVHALVPVRVWSCSLPAPT